MFFRVKGLAHGIWVCPNIVMGNTSNVLMPKHEDLIDTNLRIFHLHKWGSRVHNERKSIENTCRFDIADSQEVEILTSCSVQFIPHHLHDLFDGRVLFGRLPVPLGFPDYLGSTTS